jgi:hypothetical protein
MYGETGFMQCHVISESGCITMYDENRDMRCRVMELVRVLLRTKIECNDDCRHCGCTIQCLRMLVQNEPCEMRAGIMFDHLRLVVLGLVAILHGERRLLTNLQITCDSMTQ